MTDDAPDLDRIEAQLALWRMYVRPDTDPTEMELWGAVRAAVDVLPWLIARARLCAELESAQVFCAFCGIRHPRNKCQLDEEPRP